MVYLKGRVVVTGGLIVCNGNLRRNEGEAAIDSQVKMYESFYNYAGKYRHLL